MDIKSGYEIFFKYVSHIINLPKPVMEERAKLQSFRYFILEDSPFRLQCSINLSHSSGSHSKLRNSSGYLNMFF